MMVAMEKAQDLSGCTVLIVQEMSPPYLTVHIITEITFIIFNIMNMITVITDGTLELAVQVCNQVIVICSCTDMYDTLMPMRHKQIQTKITVENPNRHLSVLCH